MNYEFKNKKNESFIFDGDNIVIFDKNKYDESIAKKMCRPVDGFRTKYFSHVALITNNNCNLGCEYCYANKGNFDKAGNVMSFSTAKTVIDQMFENAQNHGGDKLGITFFGGEPLLQFELIKRVIAYVNNINKKNFHVAYSVITNGTLFTDEVINFLADNDFVVTVSLDGTKEVHDRMRKFKDGRGSFDVIAQSIEKYKKLISFKCRLTINDNNTNVVDSISQIRELGIEKIIVGVDAAISNEGFNSFFESYKELMENYYYDLVNGELYCIENITFNLAKIITRRRISSHCNAGRSYFTVSADDKVYDCHRLVGMKEGYVCTLDSGFEENIDCYSKKMDMEIKGNVGDRVAGCASCSFKYLCGGMCYHHAYLLNGKRFSKTPKDCMITQFEMKALLEIITSLEVEQRRKFISYVLNCK